MDAWRRPADETLLHDGLCSSAEASISPTPPTSPRPLVALYLVDLASGSRQWISPAFDASVLSSTPSDLAEAPLRVDTPAGGGGGQIPSAGFDAIAEMLSPTLRHRFSSVEAVPHEGGPPARVVEVSPRGGTLAIFDAVTVPHEVMPTLSGARVAIAGWFHEEQQPFPEWFDERSAPERGSAHGKPVVCQGAA